ncbi:hypothetical protein FOPG_18056 [Fusarium oxysporum f. sp. conglutinans race 2 54008]|uniref:Uncharacterized protein n=1 Tax=Fusarium oxysporum f. sp. conglutinans race 2 54008 TaxID=1089457 RepID=X0GQ19_FUSOX|nr:hypothetical protein FOPG_18056 [Fusarium oxysporum f. sp. conglutinans race 2 54008]
MNLAFAIRRRHRQQDHGARRSPSLSRSTLPSRSTRPLRMKIRCQFRIASFATESKALAGSPPSSGRGS